jgi:hypothetical protein
MKNIHILLCALLVLVIASCSKTYTEPVYTPDANKWLINTDTFGPASFKYYDTANVIYGGIKGVGSIKIFFSTKPKMDGQYVLRAKADEVDEICILVTDSVKNLAWLSTDDDGLPLKKEQFASVKVNGSNVGVAFNELWLKETLNVNKAKISINIQ